LLIAVLPAERHSPWAGCLEQKQCGVVYLCVSHCLETLKIKHITSVLINEQTVKRRVVNLHKAGKTALRLILYFSNFRLSQYVWLPQ